MSFKNLFKSPTSTSSRRRPARRPSSARLSVEALEDRCVPSAYSIVQIPLMPQDVNAHGQVVGRIENGPAALWQEDTLINLGSLAGPGGSSIAYAINDLGQIVGSTQVASNSPWSTSAFLITLEDTDQDGSPDRWYRDDNQDGMNDLMIALPALSENAGGFARDINNSGQVVGESEGRPVLWQNGEIIDLGSLVASYSNGYAAGINDHGQVVGLSINSAFLINPEDTNGDGSPDRWYRDADNDGVNDLMIAVGQWGAPFGYAAAISFAGHVVGKDGHFSFLWTPFEPNGTSGNFDYHPDYQFFYPFDVNASGRVAAAYVWSVDGGETGESSAGSVALLWENGETYNLTDLIPPDSGWSDLYSADAINDNGWIVGTINGTDGYLMIPTGDEIPSKISIGDTTVTEGNNGTRNALFTVRLSAASSQPVSVNFDTASGEAIAGSDFQAISGTVTFAPGETTKTITVLVEGDRLGEPDEKFVVNLSSPTNATITDGFGVGTITDDEPRISISDFTKAEGKSGKTTLFTFTVTLSVPYDQPVTMSFRTVNGTATTGYNDYVAKTGTLTFAPGETTKTITIEVKGDSRKEANETFYLDLFGLSGNALFTKNRGIATIWNDD